MTAVNLGDSAGVCVSGLCMCERKIDRGRRGRGVENEGKSEWRRVGEKEEGIVGFFFTAALAK